MSKKKTKAIGSTDESLDTELPPIPVAVEAIPPCILCKWLEKRLNNTLKEQIKHMEKYHVS